MELKIKNKTALVFASSEGLGKAVATALINEGVRVAICSRSEERISATAKEIGAAAYYEVDFGVEGAAKEVCEKVLKDLGSLDILVTNAGGPSKGNFMDISSSQWQADFQSLWISVNEAMQAVIPSMQTNGFGRILMITSMAAKKPIPGLTTSNGLRAGLGGLAKSAAIELAPSGITVNCMLPGYTNTNRMKALNLAEEQVSKMVPAGRFGEPHEFASLAAYLASEQAAYITGQSIIVDGGSAL
jgi:3-oxoacyl-[acyl-carrier protein] reductase